MVATCGAAVGLRAAVLYLEEVCVIVVEFLVGVEGCLVVVELVLW